MHRTGQPTIESYRATAADLADALCAGDFEAADFAVGRLFVLFGWLISDAVYADQRDDSDARRQTSYIRLATDRLGAAGLRAPHAYISEISHRRAAVETEISEPPFRMPTFRGVGVH